MNIIIWESIRSLYEHTPYNFEEDLKRHLHEGYVFSGPDYFLMGRAVDDRGWLVSLGIGELGKLISLMPYHLPYVGFSRHPSGIGPIKWHQTNRLIKHYENQTKSKS